MRHQCVASNELLFSFIFRPLNVQTKCFLYTVHIPMFYYGNFVHPAWKFFFENLYTIVPYGVPMAVLDTKLQVAIQDKIANLINYLPLVFNLLQL